MKKNLALVLATAGVLGLSSGNGYAVGDVTSEVKNSTSEVRAVYFNPFEIPLSGYDGLNDSQKDYLKRREAGEIKEPGDAPGAQIMGRYLGKRSSRRNQCDFLGNILYGLFGFGRR